MDKTYYTPHACQLEQVIPGVSNGQHYHHRCQEHSGVGQSCSCPNQCACAACPCQSQCPCQSRCNCSCTCSNNNCPQEIYGHQHHVCMQMANNRCNQHACNCNKPNPNPEMLSLPSTNPGLPGTQGNGLPFLPCMPKSYLPAASNQLQCRPRCTKFM